MGFVNGKSVDPATKGEIFGSKETGPYVEVQMFGTSLELDEFDIFECQNLSGISG